jgi:superfamily II DNA or RNA helicase
MKIKSIKKIDYQEDVYNLRIRDNHNYFANGLLVSNCHQTNTKSIKTIIGKAKGTKYRFGLTGTMPPDESAELYSIYASLGPLIMKIEPEFLFNAGYATPIDVRVIRMDYMSDEQKAQLFQLRTNKSKNDIDGTKLFQLEKQLVIDNVKRHKFVCDFINRTTKNSLVLFNSVAEGYGHRLYDTLRSLNADKEVFYVDGGTKQDLRDEYIRRLEHGSNKIMVATYGTFSTGISIKNLHNIFLTESFKSEILIGQSLGRMMRQHGDKDRALVIDFVDDFTWRGKQNYLMKHSDERIMLYDKRKFGYTIFEIKLPD